MATSALDKLRGLFRLWLHGPEGPRGADPPPEPSMDDLMNLCCGPRILSKALHLRGEDLPADSGNNDPAEGSKPRG